jgi:hypothetical protein
VSSIPCIATVCCQGLSLAVSFLALIYLVPEQVDVTISMVLPRNGATVNESLPKSILNKTGLQIPYICLVFGKGGDD